MPKALRPLEERFWEKVEKTEVCWLWTGSKTKQGYGMFLRNSTRANRLTIGAHRMSKILETGEEIPEGMWIDHLCRTPACVRPDHLEIVTPTENCVRGLASWAFNGDLFCFRGHPLTPENIYIREPSSGRKNPMRNCLICKREQDRTKKRLSRRALSEVR